MTPREPPPVLREAAPRAAGRRGDDTLSPRADSLAGRAAARRAAAAGAAPAALGRRLGHHRWSACASCCSPRPLRPRRAAWRASRRGRWRCSPSSPRSRSASRSATSSAAIPRVAFLFVLVGIKFLETRRARDGTLLVCLACFLLDDAVLLQPVAARGARGAARRRARRRRARRARRDRRTLGAMRGGWRDAAAAPSMMFVQGLPIAVLLFLLFPRLAAPLWGLPADHAAQTGLSDTMAPGQISELSLSDAVAFRVDFDGPRRRRRRQRYWRGPVLSRLRRPRSGRRRRAASSGIVRARRRAPAIIYTVTLEPTSSRGCSRSTCRRSLPQTPADTESDVRTDIDAVLTRDQQLSRARRSRSRCATQQRRCCAIAIPRRGLSSSAHRDNLGLPATGQSAARSQFARELREAHPDDARLHRRGARLVSPRGVRLYAGAAAARARSGRRVPVRHAARLLRALRERVRVLLRAAGIPARVVTGYQGGTINRSGDYMIVRQSDAHAWAEALVDGQWQRFDPTAAVAPSRIELGLGGALAAGEPMPFLARLDDGWLKSAAARPGMRSTTTGAATSSASTAIGSARCGASGSSTFSRRGRSSTHRRGLAALWMRRLAGLARVAPPPPGARARAVGRRLRAPRARRPAARIRTKGRSLMSQRAARALAAVRDRVRGHRRVVRGAALRRGRGARGHERSSARRALWRLRRAVRILPTAATLRRCAGRHLLTRGALQQRVAIEPAALQPRAQLLERLRLDLAHALARDADLARELLERRDVATVESVAALDHDALARR